MCKFTVGDRVRRIEATPFKDGPEFDVGFEGVVSDVVNARSFNLEGHGGYKFSAARFERVQPAENNPAAMPANPKQIYGDRKVPLHLIGGVAKAHEAAALHSGRLKYGENNFIHTPVEALTYIGACERHLAQFKAGERVDAKELVHHLGAVRACCNILLEAEAAGMLIDNRPVVGGVSEVPKKPVLTAAQALHNTFEEVEATVAHLNKLYTKE